MGSSARINSGSLANALAKATRCCSPPLSCEGKWFARCSKPTVFSSSRRLFSQFLRAVFVSTPWEKQRFQPPLTLKPNCMLEKQSPHGCSGNLRGNSHPYPVKSCPATKIFPFVGRSIPPMMLSRVVFPEPEGPHITAKLALWNL